MRTLHYELTIDIEIDPTLVSRGRPATGPTYDCGGTPAEPPEFEVKVRYNGVDITEHLTENDLDEIRDYVEEELSDEEPDCDDSPYDDD